MPVGLDDLDRRLLALLRADARAPAVTLAATLGVSRGTVQNRIDRLRATGVIAGFTVRLTAELEGGVRALTSLEIRSGDEKAVRAALKRLPEAARVYSTNGRWDMVVEISAGDLAGLDRVLGGIRAVRGVAHSETSILLSEL
jgi:DNA-binding Lrp family transcriptional regulator